MKEKVLSNIIEYVTTQDVNVPIIESFENVNVSEYSFNMTSPSLIWLELTDLMKFDKVSTHLLQNFKDAIDNENYIGASYMRKEILNRWDLREDDFWRAGKDLLVDLKNGVNNSEILNDQESIVGDILYSWNNNGFEEYDYVLSNLLEFQDYLTNYFEKEKMKSEVLSFIMSDNSDIQHPLLIIDVIVEYFKLIKE
jgi:hypothetical protein